MNRCIQRPGQTNNEHVDRCMIRIDIPVCVCVCVTHKTLLWRKNMWEDKLSECQIRG